MAYLCESQARCPHALAELRLVMPVIDTDGDGKFSVQELADFVKLSTRIGELAQRIAAASSRCAAGRSVGWSVGR